MPTIDCPHPSAEDTSRVCTHLLDALGERFPTVDLYKRFTGRGREYDALCTECRAAEEAATDSTDALLRTVCRACLELIESEAMWDGMLGQPEVLVRPSDLAFHHEIVTIRGVEAGTFLDVQPVDGRMHSTWVALTANGHLVGLDLAAGTTTTLAQLPDSTVDLSQPVVLHVDHHGQFAAVVNRRGQQGVVIDLRTGSVTMQLDRGSYRTENSAFPAAFFESDDRPLLVHGTDWNRVDVSDPATGRLLTERARPVPTTDQPRPPHYLDYFHATLLVSPDQQWIADHGWVWAPAGIMYSWSLRHWLEENVWEADDGPTMQHFCQRWYFWDGPWCWVDNRTLATWGYGTDDENLIQAAWLFDVESGEERGWFAGPSDTFIFDEYLFSLGGGTAVWDIATGERLFFDHRLQPTRYHRGSKQFLTVLPDGLFKLSRLTGAPISLST